MGFFLPLFRRLQQQPQRIALEGFLCHFIISASFGSTLGSRHSALSVQHFYFLGIALVSVLIILSFAAPYFEAEV